MPAAFATAGFPRLLAWLGAAEWGISPLATLFLAIGLPGHTFLLGGGVRALRPLGLGERVVAGARSLLTADPQLR